MKYIFLVAFALTMPLIGFSQTIERDVLVAAPTAGQSRYSYLPFDVPPGAKSLSITYEYDKRDGQNTLDLGLFDSRFQEGTLDGFRGWSGGRRNTVFLSSESASHGYLPGPIPAGQWRVILGLYKVVPEGVSVKLKVRINEIDAGALVTLSQEKAKEIDVPKTTRRFAPPQDSGYKWFRGDLHMHTFHSDGQWTINGLASYANAIGLDFIGITEHNTKSHHAEIGNLSNRFPGGIILRGEEITTYGGHINTWGLKDGEMIDFRVTPSIRSTLSPILADIKSKGLLASINHPTAICGGCAWTYGDDWAGMDSVEIWNGPWDVLDEAALTKWDALLKRGSRITAIGSSDSHGSPSGPGDRQNPGIGIPTNFVGAKRLSERAILSSVKGGRVTVGASPGIFLSLSSGRSTSGDLLTVKKGRNLPFKISSIGLPSGTTIRVVVSGSATRDFAFESERQKIEFNEIIDRDGYVRIEARSSDNKVLAFTNPIYVKVSI